MVTSLTSSGEPCSFVALSPRPLSASRMRWSRQAGRPDSGTPACPRRLPAGGRSSGPLAWLSPDNYQMIVAREDLDTLMQGSATFIRAVRRTADQTLGPIEEQIEQRQQDRRGAQHRRVSSTRPRRSSHIRD